MNIATQYAAALYKSRLSDDQRLKNLRTALKRRGHLKLLPRIAAEYEKLLEGVVRSKEYKKTTKESEQTRVLLELYQKLVHSSTDSTGSQQASSL